jgi:peptidoglycan/xylan/chitin deacetylase (PgdA/CDA1 family)
MPLWRALLLNLYYHASLPMRWWSVYRGSRAQQVPLVVLYYHRIADDAATPWTISNDMFARQIGWLRKHFELISLEETQRRVRRGNDRPAVSITFDDGYSENCRHAIPFLVKEWIPCTYFVSIEQVLESKPFDHDVALGHRFPPNSIEQLRAMAEAGIEIGAHTYSHADLGAVRDFDRLYFELVAARNDLSEAIGRRIRYFAFPYGRHANMSCAAMDLAVTSGYRGVCSAYGGYNVPGDDAFHIQRIPVDTTMIRLKNWATCDPRKRRIPRFAWNRTGAESRRMTSPV